MSTEGYLFKWTEGETLGDAFLLKEKLGKGTYGVVGRAIRLQDSSYSKRGAEVALKIPFDQDVGEENLKQEPEIIRLFNHENIVKVYGYLTISGLFVIEMELVKGSSLAEILDNQSFKNPDALITILNWIKQVVSALKAMGEYAHGDIKPQNILIREDGMVKLVDFGTSRRMEDVWVFTRGQGTEQYMAPEVALDNKRVSMKSDLYSLGVILYEIATGDIPFHSSLERLQGKALIKPRELNETIPGDLEKIIIKCLERDPNLRYATWEDFTRDLDQLLLVLNQKRETIAPLPETHRYEFHPEPASPLYYLDKAKKALADENYTEALKNAEAAVAASDNHPNYLRMLAAVCLRSQYLEKAKAAFQTLQEKYDHGYPVEKDQRLYVLRKLGDLNIRTHNYTAAIHIWRRLVDETDNKPLAKFKLAIAYGLDGDYKPAIRLLEEIKESYPDSVVVYDKLAWAYALNGNYRQALSYYNEALVIDPTDLFSLYELGKYYFISGDKPRANKYFERIQKYDRTGEYQAKVREIEQ
jgi:serine/threonine protein kinase